MKKIYMFGILLAMMLPASLLAQDSIASKITQYDLKDCDWVDFCENSRYAIVTKDGKQGIYDLDLCQNVTEIEFREVKYMQDGEAVDSIQYNWFLARKGIKRGILSLCENDNSIMIIWSDDPHEVFSLGACTTIDRKMVKKAERLLTKLMENQQMENAQIVVLDAKSGLLKTWIRLDRDHEKDEAGKLLAHACAASLSKPFHAIMSLEEKGLSLDSMCNGMSYRHAIKALNSEVIRHAIHSGYRQSLAEKKWRQMTDTQHPVTNPFMLAVGYNSLFRDGEIIIPTLEADSVRIDEDVFSPQNLFSLRDVLRVDRTASPHLSWLSTDSEWLGYATIENLYAEDDQEQTTLVGKQIQFAGLFPIENPRYTICLVGDTYSTDATPALFQDVVNPLARWLLKRK